MGSSVFWYALSTATPTRLPSVVISALPTIERPLVPEPLTGLGYGSSHSVGGARGPKHPGVTDGHIYNELVLATYNGRTLKLNEHLTDMKVVLDKI